MEDKSKLIAIAIAMIAAILVMLAGKSCSEDAIKKNRKSFASTVNTIYRPNPDSEVQNVQVQPEEDQEFQGTTIPFETVTNLFGEVVETIPATAYINENGELVEVTTVQKSILEEYNDEHKEENAETTAVVTTTRYVEPATSIVINLN